MKVLQVLYYSTRIYLNKINMLPIISSVPLSSSTTIIVVNSVTKLCFKLKLLLVQYIAEMMLKACSLIAKIRPRSTYILKLIGMTNHGWSDRVMNDPDYFFFN